jgi:hypothetical protein
MRFARCSSILDFQDGHVNIGRFVSAWDLIGVKKSALLVGAALASMQSMAVAQTTRTDDLIIMRRIIARPNPTVTPTPAAGTSTPTPTPTPTDTPTPTPTATSTPTPDPTPTPSQYEKVATQAILQVKTLPYPSVNKPTYTDTLDYSTNASGVVCRDKTTMKAATNPAACDGLDNPPSVGTQTITATFQPTLKIAVIVRQDLLGKAPDLTNMDAVCAQATGFNATGGNAEGWKVSCNAADLTAASDYKAIGIIANAMTMRDDNFNRASFPGSADYAIPIPINPRLDVGLCRQISTGQNVDLSKCVTTGPGLYVPGTISPGLRTAYIPRDEMYKIMPEITAQGMATLCSSTLSMVSSNGYTTQAYTHRVRCDADSLRNHYEMLPSRAYPTASYPNLTAYATDTGSDYTAPLTINTSQNPVCTDTDTGNAVPTADQVVCDNIAKPKIGQIKITGTYSAAYRRVFFNWEDLVAIAPAADNASNKTAACAMDISVYNPQNSGYATFKTTCNMADLRRHHVKVATNAYNSGSFLTTKGYYSDINTGPDFTMMQNVNMSVSNPKCRDTDNGAILAANANSVGSPCQYLAESSETQLRQYEMRVSPVNKTITVRWSDLLANSPNLTNKAEFCGKTGVYLYTTNYTNSVNTYKMVCD